MDKKEGSYDVMEGRPSTGSFRQRSKVPRARGSRPLSCDVSEFSPDRYEKTIQKPTDLQNVSFDDPRSKINSSSYAPTSDEETCKVWDELLGQKVCISGVKQGILRFYGKTQFAEGIWCGVELDEAVGKNDGTVSGVHYFSCKPNHGIFAPVSKVEKLDPKTAVQNGSGFAKDFEYGRSSHEQICPDYNVKFLSPGRVVNRILLKQSSSDPSLVSEHSGGAGEFDDLKMNGNLGDKRSLTEQRELSSISRSEEDPFSLRFTDISGKYETLPFAAAAVTDTSDPCRTNGFTEEATCSSPNPAFREESEALVAAQHDAVGEEQRRTDVVSFTRKAMSEDALSRLLECDASSAIKQSLSFPQGSMCSIFLEQDDDSSLLATPTNPVAEGFPEDLTDFLSKAHSLDDYKKESVYMDSFLSAELYDRQYDIDDDQISLDFDESLGILTPNQMKDFTICADSQISCADKGAVSFPSSESFDDINDLPEDEQVHDITVQYISSESSSIVQKLAMTRTGSVPLEAQNGGMRESRKESVEKRRVNSTDHFLYSISKKLDSEDVETDTNSPNIPTCDDDFTVGVFNDVDNREVSSETEKSEALKDNKEVAESKNTDQIVNKVDSQKKSLVVSIANEQIQPPSCPQMMKPKTSSPILEIRNRSVLFTTSDTASDELDSDSTDGKSYRLEPKKSGIEQNHLYRKLTGRGRDDISTIQHFVDEVSCRKSYDTDSSRDSLLQGDHENITCKEKLTVSWEDCVTNDSDEMFTRDERPDSVYTVGSSDTGYQEDGEFEGEVGMMTSVESSEDGKRFSTTSRDSCVVTEDVEGDKVAESTSTSGYSTGLSDSCSNDRADDESCKPLTDDSFQDVGDEACPSEELFPSHQSSPLFRVVEGGTMEAKQVDESYDTDNTRDSENASEVPDITETDTVLCMENTYDGSLCDTLIEEITAEENTTLMKESDSRVGIFVEEMDVAAKEDYDTNAEERSAQIIHGSDASSSTHVKKPEERPQEDQCLKSSTESSSSKSTPEKKGAKTTKHRMDKQESPKKSKKPDLHTSDKSSSAGHKKSEDLVDKKKQTGKSPRKNVMSKIKAMIEATSCKTLNRNKADHQSEQSGKKGSALPKKSRWEAVTSKIAASLAEEKSKPKAKKDVKSRVDTNLANAKLQGTCKSPRLDMARLAEHGDGSLSPSSVSSKDRRFFVDNKRSTIARQELQAADLPRGRRSPRPGKSSRSTSPVAPSESSTTMSLASHNSRSRIAVWKGSSSTVASSGPPVQLKKQASLQTSAPAKSTAASSRSPSKAVSKKGSVKMTRLVPTNAKQPNNNRPVSPRGCSPKPDSVQRMAVKPAICKEQSNARPVHQPPPKPVRPPMWLSRAELSQEIQHLGTLCEARTKELNLFKLKLKHASLGFDAFASLVKYLSEDLDAFSHPQLVAELKITREKLQVAQVELQHYEKELEELKKHHSKELTELSEKLFQVYQCEVQELTRKQNEELSYFKDQHQQQVDSLTASFKASAKKVQYQHERVVEDLKQELLKQREESKMFYESELQDTEERFKASQSTLKLQLQQMQQQYSEIKQHAKLMEDALQRDTDSKLQWLSSKKADLEKEVDSLKAVLEMKNNELHSLRKENLEMQKQLEDLPVCKEKIKMLHARAEDLQALVAEKVRIERQLSTEHQVMKETYEKESKVNKRLSMENEELQWRLKQSAETSLLLNSLAGSPDVLEKLVQDLSPLKSPRPLSASRPMFFTYIDPDDADSQSPQSPRTQYKRITQPLSSPYKSTSPNKTYKSPSTPSPRKSKGSNETSPRGTPRKVAKQLAQKNRISHQRHRRIESDDGRFLNESNLVHTDSSGHAFPESMVSSTSSESSVFDQRFLEEHEDQILASLEILREQRNAEYGMDVSSRFRESQTKWYVPVEQIGEKNATAINQGDALISDQDVIPILGEIPDPKKYYHMAFPVLKESGQDCDTDDVSYRFERNVGSTMKLSSGVSGEKSLPYHITLNTKKSATEASTAKHEEENEWTMQNATKTNREQYCYTVESKTESKCQTLKSFSSLKENGSCLDDPESKNLDGSHLKEQEEKDHNRWRTTCDKPET